MSLKIWARFIAIVFLLFPALQGVAQFRFSGKVVDAETRQPVAGASILLKGAVDKYTYSKDNGSFEIKDIPSGKYQLHVSYLGYETLEQTLSLDHNVENHVLSLKNVGVFVKPVEIISTRAGKNAPFTKTNITGNELKNKNLGQDLPFLLKQQPGVFTTSDAGAGVGYTGIWIRGTDPTRINVTFNGIPVNDAESSAAIWVDYPDLASSTGSIQIQRGVGASTNGAGAFGATINLSTNEFHAKPYGQVSSSVGSFNTMKNMVKAGSGLLNDHFTVDARLSYITSDGYMDRASSDLKSFYFSTAYFNKKTSVRFNVFSGKEKTYQSWNGVPEDSLQTNRTYNGLGLMPNGKYYDDQTDNYMQTYYQLFLNREINKNYNFSISGFLTRGKGYYEEYKMDEPYNDYGLADPVIGGDTLKQTDLIRDLWLDNYFYGTVFSLNHEKGTFDWTLGGSWDRYDGKHYGNVIWSKYAIDKGYQYYYNTAYKNDFNVYWKGNKNITSSLQAFIDLQYRHISYKINGFKHHPDIIQNNKYDFFNPKLGLSYNLNDHNRLYASYAIAHKEPNRDDFEANIKDVPEPEQLGDVEIGFDKSGSSYHFHANIYYMHYKNQLVLTGKINDVGAYTRTNIPKSYRLGLELNGDIQFAKIFTLSANAAFSRNRIKGFTEYIDNYDNGKQKVNHYSETDISFSPAVISGASLSVAPVKRLLFALSGKYISRRYLDNTDQESRSLDPYLVNDLLIHYSWQPKWISSIDLNLLVNNLFNVKYLTNGYTYSYISDGEMHTENNYFPQAGTNFLFGVTIDF